MSLSLYVTFFHQKDDRMITYEPKKINAFRITRMFCVWKINHLCWGITPSTCEEISRSCENRIAQAQPSRDLLGMSTAQPQGRPSYEKLWMQVSVNGWKQTSQEMDCFVGKGKKKRFCPLLLIAFLNELCHFLGLSIALLLSLSTNCLNAPSLIHRSTLTTLLPTQVSP